MGEEGERFDSAELRSFAARVLEQAGVPVADARTAAAALVHADLLGFDSHGIGLLPRHGSYLVGLRSGVVNAQPHVRVVRETPSTAVLDGDGGLGAVTASRAMELAIGKAGATGCGFVAVRNSRHFGAAAHYTLMATARGMIGIAMCNAPGVQMAPTFGREPRLASNPISIAAPTREEPTFLMDMATSVVAGGRVSLAARDRLPIPEGWILDRYGQPTTDPRDLAQGGTLLPLGSRPETGSYKGYALAVAVDILAGILSGTGYGAALGGRQQGLLLGAWQIDAFMPVPDFTTTLDAALRALRDTPPAEGQTRVLTPGERASRLARERGQAGIPLHPAVVEELRHLGTETGVPFPSPTRTAGPNGSAGE